MASNSFRPNFSKTDIENINARFTIASYSPSLGEGVALAQQQGNGLALKAIARVTGVPIPQSKPPRATVADYARLDKLVGGDRSGH